MKNVAKVLTAALLSAVVAAAAVCTASAAGINAAEQKILDALNTTVNLNGIETPCPAQYVNQAENYFNVVDITDAEAEAIVADIEAVKDYLESTGVSRYTELDDAQIDQVVLLSNVASGEIEVSLVYDKQTRVVTAYDKDGNVIANVPVDDDPTGGNGGSGNQGGDNGGNGSGTGDNGGNGGNAGGNGGNGGVIKTTGFDAPSVVAVAGLGLLLVTGAGVYLIKTSKKENGDV